MKTKLPISYLSRNFKDWFGDFDVKPVKCELKSVTLDEPMNDSEIIAKWNPEPVTLGEMTYTLKSLSHDVWAIFYIKDQNGVLRAVRVFWFDDGWDVYALSVERPLRWSDGGQVFSRNFSESPSPLPDTLTINGVIYKRQ